MHLLPANWAELPPPRQGARSRFAAGGSGRPVRHPGRNRLGNLQAHRRNLFAARYTQSMLDRRLPPLRSLQHHLAVGCCAFPPASCSLAVALEDGFFATTVLLRVVVRRNSHETHGLMKANGLQALGGSWTRIVDRGERSRKAGGGFSCPLQSSICAAALFAAR